MKIVRIIELVAWPILWAALVLGALQSKELVISNDHFICGPWGCGPGTDALKDKVVRSGLSGTEGILAIFSRCLQALPPNQAAAFVDRDVNERNSADVCKILEITATNLWVLMHRARIRLAECIRTRWELGND